MRRSLALALQEVEELRLDRHVEGGRRLVGDQHGRVRSERDRHRDPLAQPARELVRDTASAAGSAPARRPPRAAKPPCARASCRERPRWVSRLSVIWRPTVSSGFRLVIESWKTIAIRRPRICAKLPLRRAHEIFAVELDRASDDAAGRRQKAA